MTDMKRPPGMFVPKGTSNYAYRKTIPVELRDHFQQGTFYITLGTNVYQDALQVYYRVAAHYENELTKARLGRPTGSAYDTQKRKRIKQSQLSKKNIFAYTDKTNGDEWFDPEIMPRKEVVIYQENLFAQQRIAELEQNKLVGDIDIGVADKEITALQHLINGNVPKGEPKSSKNPRFSKVLPEYLKEVEAKLASVTYHKKVQQTARFLKAIGNKHIDAYTQEHGRKFLAYMQRQKPPLSANTVNQYLDTINSVFKWLAVRYDDKIKSPVKGFHITEHTQTVDKRKKKSFTKPELTAIFAVLDKTNSLYWPSLCSLYSSMRGGEVVGLTTDDVKTDESGILFFDLHGERLKTPLSKRQIPVHARLIELGFVDYLKTIKSGQLFPSFAYGKRGSEKKNADIWQNRLSVRFSKYLTQIGIKHSAISFHSLRHNFVDGCRKPNISWNITLWIQGRTEPGTGGGYGGGPTMADKQSEINKISYDFKNASTPTLKQLRNANDIAIAPLCHRGSL